MQKIDAKYLWDYKPVKKEDKDFEKNKSADTPLANTSSKK